jgi:hypothetical protein
MRLDEAEQTRQKIDELQKHLATADPKRWREIVHEINLLIVRLKKLPRPVED